MSIPRGLSEGRPVRALTLVSVVMAWLVLSGCGAQSGGWNYSLEERVGGQRSCKAGNARRGRTAHRQHRERGLQGLSNSRLPVLL
jgi:hypothetical protein